jgi:hypothetical protein
MVRKSPRVFYEVLSRRDEVVDVTAASVRRYQERIRCPVCTAPRAEWDERPVPIDVEITESVRGCVATASMMCNLQREDFHEAIKPYLEGIAVGSVHFVNEELGRRSAPYVTCFVPRHLELEVYRGRYCRHFQCRACGRFTNEVGWAAGAIVERYLDHRLAYLDGNTSIYIDGRLAQELKLKERFPDIRLYRFDVIPEPLDGDVMPGDPGWDGTFRRQTGRLRPPILPPRKGRHSYDGTEGGDGPGCVTLYVRDQSKHESPVNVAELESWVAKAVDTASVGKLEQQGRHRGKRASYLRYRGPDIAALHEVMNRARNRYGRRVLGRPLSEDCYFTAQADGRRERRVML